MYKCALNELFNSQAFFNAEFLISWQLYELMTYFNDFKWFANEQRLSESSNVVFITIEQMNRDTNIISQEDSNKSSYSL